MAETGMLSVSGCTYCVMQSVRGHTCKHEQCTRVHTRRRVWCKHLNENGMEDKVVALIPASGCRGKSVRLEVFAFPDSSASAWFPVNKWLRTRTPFAAVMEGSAGRADGDPLAGRQGAGAGGWGSPSGYNNEECPRRGVRVAVAGAGPQSPCSVGDPAFPGARLRALPGRTLSAWSLICFT